MDLLIWIILAFVLHGYFAAMETAYTSFDRIVSRGWTKAGTFGAKIVAFFAGHTDRFLGTTLVGVNSVEVAYSSLVVLWADAKGIDPLWIMLISPVMILTFGEIIPKIFAHALANPVVRYLSFPLRGFHVVFQPVIWILKPFFALSRVTRTEPSFSHKRASAQFLRRELDQILSEAESEGTVTEGESMILTRYLQARDVQVWEIMTPRTKMIAIQKGASVSETVDLFLKCGHAILPIYDGNLDNIIGLLRRRDFLITRKSIDEVMHPKVMVPESKLIIDLLHQFKESKLRVAIVVDEHGGTDGIVTLKDIFRELVGPVAEQWDPTHILVKKLAPGRYLASGAATISEIAEITGWNPPEGDYSTIAGMISDIEGRIPKVGDEIDFNEVTIRVVSSTHRRVETCLIRLKNQVSNRKSANSSAA